MGPTRGNLNHWEFAVKVQGLGVGGMEEPHGKSNGQWNRNWRLDATLRVAVLKVHIFALYISSPQHVLQLLLPKSEGLDYWVLGPKPYSRDVGL